MSEDNQQNHSPSTATPAGNQNLIIGLVLGAAILLLLFLVFSNQNSNTPEAARMAELQLKLEEMKRNSSNGSQSLAQNLGNGANSYGVDPVKLADEISTEANTLAGLIGNFGDTIQQKDALLDTARDTEALLNRRIQDLQRQMNDLSSSAAESVKLRKELESLRALYDNAQHQIEELRKRPDSATLAEIRRENEALRQRLLDLGELDSENRKLREENRRLQALLDRSTLFVESADALPDQAKRLFRELERLENYSPAELENQYQRIQRTLNARPLRAVNFTTGSSQLTNEKISIMQNDLQSTHPGAFLLVVGYASKIGDTESNRQLSSKRATAVASQVNLDKRSSQDVRAVFLSETSRFSKEQAPLNQICEIWEIQP